jgi:hypothetical protein
MDQVLERLKKLEDDLADLKKRIENKKVLCQYVEQIRDLGWGTEYLCNCGKLHKIEYEEE